MNTAKLFLGWVLLLILTWGAFAALVVGLWLFFAPMIAKAQLPPCSPPQEFVEGLGCVLIERPQSPTEVMPAPPIINPSDLPPVVGEVSPPPEEGTVLPAPTEEIVLGVLSVIGSGILPFDPAVPIETAAAWYNDVVSSSEPLGIAHYEASVFTLAAQRATIAELLAEIERLKALIPPPPLSAAEFGCTGEFSDFRDGSGGRLWKPGSDGTGRPVFLLPNEYCGLLLDGLQRVEVYDPAGNFLTAGRFRTCEANGNRYHHDVPIDSGPLVVRLIRVDGEVECLQVPDAGVRFD